MQNQDEIIIDALVDYFKLCPLLKEGVMGVDYLEDKATAYSINPYLNPSPVIRQYTDGGALEQYPFYFQSTEIYSSDAVDMINNSGFYEAFKRWIKKQNKDKNLPDIEGIQSIEAMSNGFLYDESGGTAIYQIQCRITYITRE